MDTLKKKLCHIRRWDNDSRVSGAAGGQPLHFYSEDSPQFQTEMGREGGRKQEPVFKQQHNFQQTNSEPEKRTCFPT
jgi:hypothetical protein